MHGDVDFVREERVFDLLGEKPLAANVGEWAVQYLVTGGLDDGNANRLRRKTMGFTQPLTDLVGLGQRQRRASCSNAYRRNGSGRRSRRASPRSSP